jgi:hypothetical protein
LPEGTPTNRPRRAAASHVRTWEQRLSQAVLALGRSLHRRAGYGRPRGILYIFRLAEWIMDRLHPTVLLRPDGIVRYEIMPLPRGALPLAGQPPVRRGERVIGLHFDNRAIARMARTTPDNARLAWAMGRAANADLRVLADLVRRGGIPPDVRALWAETIYYPALTRYGFTTRPAPDTLRTPFARLFMLSLIAMYGRPQMGMAAARRRRPLELGDAWMSLDGLLRRFPDTPRRAADREGAAAPS